MRKEFTIKITMDTETGSVYGLDITEGVYNRTEVVADGIDNPISVYDTIQHIDRYLTNEL